MDLSNDHGAAPARALERLDDGSTREERVGEATRLSALWTELMGGLCKIENSAFSERNCELTVTRVHRVAHRDAVPLSQRHAEILERSLIDGARKSVAADLGLGPSSVAEILKQGFTFMGLSCWPSRIPLVLVLAAHARRSKELERAATALVAENQHSLQQTISVTRPDSDLETRLTPAEYAVLRLLVEGKSYAEMSVLRQTSSRTVANQIAAAFHRLGISGRAELMALLAARKIESWRISTPNGRAARSRVDPASGFLRVASWQGR